MLICITCHNFSKRETSNQNIYMGRCLADDIQVMIVKTERGDCGNYEQAPDAKERIAAYKSWLEKHPPKVYEFQSGTQVGKDERPAPVKKGRGRPRRKK